MIPPRARQWTLAERPSGLPSEKTFALKETPIPSLEIGQVLLQTIYLSVDPYMRGRMNDRPSYAPPVGLGETMVGNVVGQVTQSSNPKFPPGAFVEARLGWQEFAVSDGKGTVFVNIEDKSEVASIDVKKLVVTTRWPIAPGEEPTGLAFDSRSKRLFIAGSNKKMIVMDAATGKVVADLPTGDGTDGMEFDPGTKLAFSPNGQGTMTVVREDTKDKYSVVENVSTKVRARTMTIDLSTHKVYLPTAEFGPAPAPTTAQPRPRAPMVPNSFVILVYGQ